MSYFFFTNLLCRELRDASGAEQLKRLATPVRSCAGATIFTEGDPADDAFGLSEGLVRLYKRLPDGRRQILAFVLPGDFLEMPLIERYGLSADVIGDAILCRFSRHDLAKLVESKPDVMRLLVKFAARELNTARDQLALLGVGSAEERITTFLVNWRNQLSRLEALSGSARQRTLLNHIPLPMRRQDIADFTGMKLETVSRTLSRLEQKNAIRLVPKGVFLTGLERTAFMSDRPAQHYGVGASLS